MHTNTQISTHQDPPTCDSKNPMEKGIEASHCMNQVSLPSKCPVELYQRAPVLDYSERYPAKYTETQREGPRPQRAVHPSPSVYLLLYDFLVLLTYRFYEVIEQSLMIERARISSYMPRSPKDADQVGRPSVHLEATYRADEMAYSTIQIHTHQDIQNRRAKTHSGEGAKVSHLASIYIPS